MRVAKVPPSTRPSAHPGASALERA